MKNWKLNYIKIYGIALICLTAILLVFYWAAGEQLFYRESAGERQETQGNCVTEELVEGRIVEQYFQVDMDRVEKIGVLLTSNGKDVTSDVVITLADNTTGDILMKKEIEANQIGINQYVYLECEEGITGVRGHQFKLSYMTLNGTEGQSAAGVYDNSIALDGSQLYINDQMTEGTMSYSIFGSDDVWTGHAYPLWSFYLLLAFTILFCLCAYRFENNKREFVFETYFIIKKYRFLIEQIVNRDFKVKYKRSVLGMMWSFLNPLLTMAVQYIVFSQLFRSDIENFPVYLMCGTVIFSFFTEAVGLSLMSIVGNAALITKVYVPKYIYPVTRVLSSLINLLISMIPLFLAILITGQQITKAYLLIPIILICVLVFTIGVGMLLSALMVFFRDVQFLWGIISMLWMYATPLFYPESIVPQQFKFLHTVNPMYYYVKTFRMLVLDGISPEPKMYVLCAFMALISLVLGAFVFKKTQNNFVLYL
ncbi:MAG: ABC transporter permease [Alistipes sp.]|nr:ABC transporter permease [Alistipes sp.]